LATREFAPLLSRFSTASAAGPAAPRRLAGDVSSQLLRRVRRPGPLVAISLAYLVAVAGILIWRGISVSPDYLLFLLIPVAVLSGRFLGFLRDWVPFVVIFLGWEFMRAVAPNAGFAPHVADLAHLESGLFGGHVPTAVLQQALDVGTGGRVIEYAATVVYFGHFAFPFAVGMVLWLVDRVQFVRFTTALMGMALVAFVIFLLVPTAPPWYAEQQGVIGGFHRIIGTTLPSAVSRYYNSLNPNPVAAFPSLHAAFPFLGFLALRRAYPRAAWLAFAWCILVWFSVVFLGEHYVVDVIAGVALAAISWWVMMNVAVPRVGVLQSRMSNGVPAKPDPERAVA
jgi:membrane-associated phospholipid phosphatase